MPIVSQLEFHGLNAAEHLIEIEPRPGEQTLRTEDIIRRIEREGSAARARSPARRSISHRTAFDLAPLIAAARAPAPPWDSTLRTRIGNMPLRLA